MLNDKGDGLYEPPPFEPPFKKKYFSQEVMGQYAPLKEAHKAIQRKTAKGQKPTEEEQAEFDQHLETFGKMDWWESTAVDGKKYDLVFYGVSGYTGYLMAQYLKRTCLKRTKEKFTFAFAGRTVSKVQDLVNREFAGTEWENTPVIGARFDDVVSIIDMVKSAHVIINVAGPYMATQGEILVDACVHLKCHYCDISGEIPWSVRLLDLHKYAKDAGVFLCPSSASAGGYPDLGVYLCAKKLREEYGEETRKAVVFCTGGGSAQAPSGGTLKTRATMSSAGDEVREKMADPYALGGFIPNIDRNGVKMIDIEQGTGICTPKVREEDKDSKISKISQDPDTGIWHGPFVYSYFDTRVVRRSNGLFADLLNQPYGLAFNFMEFGMLPPEAIQAQLDKKAGKKPAADKKPALSVADEKKQLEAEGKYYGAGEGPPLEDLDDAWVGFLCYAKSATGNMAKCSWIGRDGYYETCRMAVEMALTLRFDYDKLPVKGGVLTPSVAGGTFVVKRLVDSGIKFKMGDWHDTADMGPPPFDP
jgi:short subunit dehydrogenase-like uncharacterized protein